MRAFEKGALAEPPGGKPYKSREVMTRTSRQNRLNDLESIPLPEFFSSSNPPY